MRNNQRTEVTVRAANLPSLFQHRDFDPLTDDPETLWSMTQLADLTHLVGDLSRMTLRVLLPREQILSETQVTLQRALQRFCAQKITETRLEFIAWRRSAWRAFALGLGFFAASLRATTVMRRAEFLPEEIRTLAVETLVIAGWVVMWQPLDDLVQGWWPIRERERVFRAIRTMQLVVGEAS